MSKIKQLSPQEAQKIAAGQVVERPANIVKELVENAIDAQARKISIYIEHGGKKLIRIVDDGCGMSEVDAQLCFAKHATSKITALDELQTISTFGFRGEALASIAAVSKVTLHTKERTAESGVSISILDSSLSEPESSGCADGTDIVVRDLFYNMPARAKFLKKTETEWRHIVSLVHAFCLSHLSIHFKLFAEGKLILNCPATLRIVDRCAQVWSDGQMIAIEQENKNKGFTVSGAISNHMIHRYDRQQIMLFVNNRWVKNHQLTTAVCKGYNNVIPYGKYPVAVVAVSIDPHQVDINIHPRKEEVKFVHPRIVEQSIEHTIRTALEAHLSHKINKKVSFMPEQSSLASFSKATAAPSFFDSSSKAAPSLAAQQEPPNQFVPFDFKQDTAASQEENPLKEAQASFEQTIALEQSFSLIGQLHKTYLLLEQEEGLFLIDQHAAHERILYEEFAARFKELPTVQLLFPERIIVPSNDMHIVQEHLPLLHDHGIVVEQSGPQELLISSTPVHLKQVSLQDLIAQFISWLSELGHIPETDMHKQLHEKLRAQMACKAAVKAGESLTREKMEQIIKQLLITPNRFSCPHGRPTGWLLHQYDIEKKFRRRG